MRAIRGLVAGPVALVLAAATMAATPATAATARAGYVGIVIAGHGSYCVPWHSGITGDEILNDVATVQYRPSDGLIDQIDGQPSPPHADDTHYWSYWHDTGGSWQYSSAGAGGYQAPAGSVDGWAYVNGSSTADPPGQAPAGLYAALCGSLYAGPAPAHPSTKAATRAHRPAAPATGAESSRAGTRGQGTRAGSAPSHRSAASATGNTPATATTGAASSGHPSRVMSTSGAAALAAASSGIDGAVTGRLAPVAATHRTSGSALPVILGIMLVLLLGAGAGWGVLRRRRADSDY